jgi:hypothetical protein
MQIAIIKDGVVQSLVVPSNIHLGPGQVAAVVPDGLEVKKHDLFDGTSFSPNPDAADILATESKKKEIVSAIQDAVIMSDLKGTVSAINQDLNGA